MEKRKANTRITLRLSPDVHDAMIKATTQSGNSLNTEINDRLRDSISNDSPVVFSSTEKLLRRIIREELNKK